MPIRPELRHFYQTPEWFAARKACRERAGDRCEHCGATNETIAVLPRGPLRRLTTVWIQCGAAHLNGMAGDDRQENLAWLCRGCHLKHDRAQHRATRSDRKDAARPLLAAVEGKELNV
jgi:5-methylcytosine-specific restriction endonuclease McrA